MRINGIIPASFVAAFACIAVASASGPKGEGSTAAIDDQSRAAVELQRSLADASYYEGLLKGVDITVDGCIIRIVSTYNRQCVGDLPLGIISETTDLDLRETATVDPRFLSSPYHGGTLLTVLMSRSYATDASKVIDLILANQKGVVASTVAKQSLALEKNEMNEAHLVSRTTTTVCGSEPALLPIAAGVSLLIKAGEADVVTQDVSRYREHYCR